ncbi:MAG: adenylate/guanylate cyclase domain-containing protein, partial [Chloroflexi bacterium]|nr:adenylate/guanylate cyclase domain-containing protein [Chloroflexota bacterium]
MVSSVNMPEGTVTVLFTDTVGSTALNQRLGDDAANALRQAIVGLCREQLERHQGIEVKGMGDGLMLAFQSARRAVRCARDIQRAVSDRNREHPGELVELRIGLHTGEVIHDEEDLFGETVVIASRLEQAAQPGTILASRSVHDLLGTARSQLRDLGEMPLKGIVDPWHVYEVPVEEERRGDPNAPA